MPQQAFKYGAKNSHQQWTILEDFHAWNHFSDTARSDTGKTACSETARNADACDVWRCTKLYTSSIFFGHLE